MWEWLCGATVGRRKRLQAVAAEETEMGDLALVSMSDYLGQFAFSGLGHMLSAVRTIAFVCTTKDNRNSF